MKRWQAVTVLLAIVVIGIAPSLAAEPGASEELPDHAHAIAIYRSAARQALSPPGHGYELKTAGSCAGTWEGPEGDCVHADFPASGELFPDEGVVYYDSDFETSGTPPRCAGASENRFRILYVTTPNRPDRYSEFRPKIRNHVENANYYVWKSAKLHGTDSRQLRLVCNADNDIIVDYVFLPESAGANFAAGIAALRAAGYDHEGRKYVAFVEWRDVNADQTRNNNCGRAQLFGDDSTGQTNENNSGNMFGFVYLPVCTSLGHASLHEMGHLLGAVQPSANRHDPENAFHPRDEHDVMAYGNNTYAANNCGDPLLDRRYDCNGNDYFNPQPGSPSSYLSTHWNTANNRFLVGGGG